MPTKDTDCKSHGADVEDDTGEEQGEELDESLQLLEFLCCKVLHFFFHTP